MRRQPLFVSRLALRRRPIVYWATSALVATACALVVGGLTARAEQAAARYGGLRTVAVVVRPVEAGDEVDADDTRLERVPRHFVPDGALSELPTGRTAVAALHPGEAVLAERLAPDGLRGVAALLPEGERALAVPRGPGTLPVAIGDTVDVLATAPDGVTRVVAGNAEVLAVGDQTATVAVTAGAAPAVATALTQATVTLSLTTG